MSLRSLPAVALALTLLSACATTAGDVGGSGLTLRLGYFPNVTHAPAIVALEKGFFAEALGSEVTIEPHTFNAGGEVVEAMAADALDVSYVGANPAINAFTVSNGEAIRVIAGTTSGGASLVVSDAITSAQDLAGTTVASPQLGNTQDVALRAWLADQGYQTDLEGGGDVSVSPQENAQILEAFRNGDIDGAWVPEPWATRLVEEGGGHVLVNEADLWPDGEFVTTQLMVATSFLEEHPDVVKRLLEGHVAAIDYVNAKAAEAQEVVATSIGDTTGAEIPEGTVAKAWQNLTFTNDPIPSSLTTSAEHAVELGLLDSADLDGIYDLTLLNEVLTDAGQAPIPQP
jgi:NitT/TauT family transport system substrate-binding protein